MKKLQAFKILSSIMKRFQLIIYANYRRGKKDVIRFSKICIQISRTKNLSLFFTLKILIKPITVANLSRTLINHALQNLKQ